MLQFATRPGSRCRLSIILVTMFTLIVPPEAFLSRAQATPPMQPEPDPPEDNCSDTCPPGLCDVTFVQEDSFSEVSSAPIALHNGAVQESAVDLTLPGPVVNWSQSRSYNSQLTNASITHLGRNWISKNGDVRLIEEGDGDVYIVSSASSKRTFDENSGAFAAPAGSGLTLEAVSNTLVLTNIRSGDIQIFNNFDVGHGAKAGRLIERTTRAWKADGKTGIVYSYDTSGRLTTITTAEGQEEQITFKYTALNSWEIDWIRVGPDPDADFYMEVDYTYGAEANTHADCGADDDLLQVCVRRKGTDGQWIERYTQYRYYTSSPLDGKLKCVIESDAIQRIIDAYSGISSPADILDSPDSYTDGMLAVLDTRVSRSFEYFEAPASTTSFESTYGGTNFDETGYAKKETINGSCASCGGDTNAGLTIEYNYINGLYRGNYAPNPMDSSGDPLEAGHINIVRRIVIEDVKSNATLLRRNVYGLAEGGYRLRKITYQDPTDAMATAFWCTSNILRNDRRVLEQRSPSAHTSVNAVGELDEFLNAYNGSSWSDFVGSGQIYVYEYNSEGWRTGVRVKSGPSEAAYYVSSTDYGTGAAPWEVVATRDYPTQTTNRTDSAATVTTYTYTYWDDPEFNQRETVTTSFEAVPTGENGSNTATTTVQYFDTAGRLRWTLDSEKYVNYFSYHPITGELAYSAIDVPDGYAPDDMADRWLDVADGDADQNQPNRGDGSGMGGGGLPTAIDLFTIREFDGQGRLYKTTDPGGAVHYTTYQNNYIAQFPYWDTGNTESLTPISVTVMNDGGVMTESYAIVGDSTSVTTSGDEPTGLSGTPSRTDMTAWSRSFYNGANGQLVKTLRYPDIPGSGDGDHLTNYYLTAFDYDQFGRRTTTIQSSTTDREQITRVNYDFLDRITSTERVARDSDIDLGANATVGTPNVTGIEEVASTVYDDGGVGDGHVTQTKQHNDLTVGSYTLMNYHRTFRGHVRGVEREHYDGSSLDDVTPYTVMDIDWLGRTIGSALYDDDTSEPNWTTLESGYSGYLASNSSNRNEWTKTHYDVLGRVYRTERYPGTQVTNHIEINNYYDRNGRLVCTGDKYAAHQEMAYDGAGRQYQTRTVKDVSSTKYDGGEFQYRAPAPRPEIDEMSDDGDDGLIEFSHTVYDASSNPIEQHLFEANHDDANGIDLDAASYVRRAVYSWYDAADQMRATADYGSGDSTAGAGEWEYVSIMSYPARPGTAPTWTTAAVYEGLALLTLYDYDSAGRQDSVTSGIRQDGMDTEHTTTKSFYDDLGRRLFVVENHDGSFNPTTTNPSSYSYTAGENRTTGFVYNGMGQTTKLTAYNNTSSTDHQVTDYFYLDDYNAALATHTIYPDATTRTPQTTWATSADQVRVEYNLDGSIKRRKDQRDVEMTYAYDNARRMTREGATSIPSSVYGGNSESDATRSIVRAYDTLGRLSTVSSNNHAAGTGSVLNEVKYNYSTVGKLSSINQDHADAVGSGTAHETVSFSYDATQSSGVYTRGLRRTHTWYPVDGNARVHMFYNSDGSADDRLRRPRYQKLFNANLNGEEATLYYEYNGTGRVARTMAHTGAGGYDIERTMQTASGVYGNWDRFGRTLKQRWFRSTTTHDEVDYTYDYAGNRLTRDIPSSLYASDDLDQLYEYDGLQRLANQEQGTLDSGAITGKNFVQDWTLDQLGNWSEFKQDDNGNGTWNLEQDREHNAVNEIDDITNTVGTAWTDPVHDDAGNMTTIPRPLNPTLGYNLVYDAWNRLVEVRATTGFLVGINEYDGNHHRIRKWFGSDQHDFYYNDQWQLLIDVKNGSTYALYVWHLYYIDALAVRMRASGMHYFLHDANFNVTAAYNITSGSGTDRQVVERYRYTPYGQPIILNADFSLGANNGTLSAIDNVHLYTGRERDSETGLQLNRYRWYHAPLGRWVSRDPIVYDDGANLYEYVHARPANAIDPTGTASIGPIDSPSDFDTVVWQWSGWFFAYRVEGSVVISPGQERWVKLETQEFENCHEGECRYCTSKFEVAAVHYNVYERMVEDPAFAWRFDQNLYNTTGGSGLKPIWSDGGYWKPPGLRKFKDRAESDISTYIRRMFSGSIKRGSFGKVVEVPCKTKLRVDFYQKVIDLNITGSGTVWSTERGGVTSGAAIGPSIGEVRGGSWDYEASWTVKAKAERYTDQIRVKMTSTPCDKSK